MTSWAAARYSHIHTLRLAWADWIACVLHKMEASFQWQEIVNEPESAFPTYFPSYESALKDTAIKQERASENLTRETQRLLLLETNEDWSHGLKAITALVVSDEKRSPDEFYGLQQFVGFDLAAKLRDRLHKFVPEEFVPKEFRGMGEAFEKGIREQQREAKARAAAAAKSAATAEQPHP